MYIDTHVNMYIVNLDRTHVWQSSWTHDGKVYGFGGFGSAPVEAEDDEDYPSYMKVVVEYYGVTSRCWNNQVSQYAKAQQLSFRCVCVLIYFCEKIHL